jgi:hypothetical protein
LAQHFQFVAIDLAFCQNVPFDLSQIRHDFDLPGKESPNRDWSSAVTHLPPSPATPCAPLWVWFSDNSLKFMFAALFLAPELFHFYEESDFFRWIT